MRGMAAAAFVAGQHGDGARRVAEPAPVRRIGVAPHRIAPADDVVAAVAPRPGGLGDDPGMDGEDALPAARPRGIDAEERLLARGRRRQHAGARPIGVAPGCGPGRHVAIDAGVDRERQHGEAEKDDEHAARTPKDVHGPPIRGSRRRFQGAPASNRPEQALETAGMHLGERQGMKATNPVFSRRRHDDLRGHVAPRHGAWRDQSRPGLPRRGRAGGAAASCRRRAPRRPQPISADDGARDPCAKPSPPTPRAITALSTIRAPASSSPRARPRRWPTRCWRS